MEKKTLKDVELSGKRVFLRVDYNVPMDAEGKITDDTRIRATIPTLKYLLEQNAAVIIASHMGRPKGKPAPQYSLQALVPRISELLGRQIMYVSECVGPVVVDAANALEPGKVLLLENLRFHKEEEANDPEFSKQLASLADLMVNDAFGVSHRAHASVEGITRHIPAVAGMLMEKEIEFLHGAVAAPKRPFVAIIGGAKVSDKIGVIENLLAKVDKLIIGGGMANTFLTAKGYSMGKSLVEPDKIELAKDLLAKAQQSGVKLLLPSDFIVAEKFAVDAESHIASIDSVPAEWMALDIGPDTRRDFAQALADAKTIVWNGPMGVFEFDAFAKGTEAVAAAVAAAQATSIVGGGDSIAALEKAKLADKITHISTGGGASLEFLEGKNLPGVAALADK